MPWRAPMKSKPCSRANDAIAFFQQMYGNEPSVWNDDLSGMTRLRVITNYLTRMRYCTPESELDLISKGPEPIPDVLADQKVAPWFSHPNRLTKDETILFGHWASLEGRYDNPNIIGLDTGCVWGRATDLLRTRNRATIPLQLQTLIQTASCSDQKKHLKLIPTASTLRQPEGRDQRLTHHMTQISVAAKRGSTIALSQTAFVDNPWFAGSGFALHRGRTVHRIANTRTNVSDRQNSYYARV